MKPLAEDSKARVVAVYDAAAATYNRVGPSFFLHFGKRLASVTGILPGSDVLDLATGTGAAVVPAAAVVGPEGRVVGIDLSSGMINRARAEIRHRGIEHAHVLVADADHLPFPDQSFDVVSCSFAIFLFLSLSRPIAESHRVLRSSGRIGFVYSAGEDSEWRWYEQLISRYRPKASLGTERYRPQDVEAALSEAGFKDVSTTVEVHQLTFANAAEFWGWAWSHGDRAVLESLTGSTVEFERELFEQFGRRAGPKGVTYRVFAALTLATRR